MTDKRCCLSGGLIVALVVSSLGLAGCIPGTTPDTTPPGNVTNLAVTVGNAKLDLSWTNPGDSDFAGIKVLRKTDAFSTSPSDGTVVFNSAGTALSDTGLTNGTHYFYTAFSYDKSSNYASGAQADGIPTAPDTTPPANIANLTATAADKQIVLAWTLPTDADFSGVKIQRKTDAFPASPTDGATAYDGNGATYTDTNLDNGQPYYYAAFSYDTTRNFASGVDASAIPTSAGAQADVLSSIGDSKNQVSAFPSTVFDDTTRAELETDLRRIDETYRAGDVCGAADATNSYLGRLQGLRHDASEVAAEILYNSGRMIRYDMLTTASTKGTCVGDERVGQDADTLVDPAATSLAQVKTTFSFGEPKIFTTSGDGEVFTTVIVPGANAGTTEVGQPAVPMMSRLVAVPDGATVEPEVVVEEAEQIQMKLYPVQQPGIAQSTPTTLTRDISPPPFAKDGQAYAQSNLYPANPVTLTDLGVLRGLRVIRVDVPVGQYNAAANTLHLFKSANVNLKFTGQAGGYGNYDPSNLFEPLLGVTNKLLLNKDILATLKPKPFTGDTAGEELLIVTHAKFLDSANTLAAYKTSSGIVTNVLQVTTINGTAPTADHVRSLIVNHWNSSQIKASYVLLIGDVNYIPPYYFAVKGTGADGEAPPPSDFAYSTLGDPAATYLSDWVVGRFPVNETAEADAVVNKIMNYEKNPPTSGDFYKHAVLCTDFECCQPALTEFVFPGILGIPGFTVPFVPPLNQGVEQQPFVKPLEIAKNVLESRGFNVERLYIESIDGGDPSTTPPRPAYTADPAPRKFCDGSDLTADIGGNLPWHAYPAAATADLMSAWNEGRIFVFYNSHGYCNGPGWWGTPFAYWDADGLATDKPLPVVFSTTCDSGFYDLEINHSCDAATKDPCFAESLIRADKRGAVTIIAAPRETLIYVNGHLTEGYANAIKTFGTTTKMRLADVFLFGQGWVHSTCNSNDAVTHNRLYHIFGDPSLRIRMQKPPLTISKVNFRATAALRQVNISCETEGATVTAYRPIRTLLFPVGRGIVKDGIATLQMLATGTAEGVGVGSTLQLVVSHPDALPVTIDATVEATASAG